MLSHNIFSTLFVYPIINLLVIFHSLFTAIKLPGAFGWSIIALTIAVRALLHPLFQKQLHTQKKMQDLKPHLDRLSHKHKDDKKKLQEEQLRLYKEAGLNPASGCVFLIIQIPIFIALYQTLNLFLTSENMGKIIQEINQILYFPGLRIATIDPQFFGFNLALAPQKAAQFHYYLMPILTGILQFWQAKVTMPTQAPAAPIEKNKDADKEKKTDTGQDFQKAMNMQMKYFFPVMIAWFSYTLPVGLSLYWNIFSLFSIMQYRQLSVKNKTSE